MSGTNNINQQLVQPQSTALYSHYLFLINQVEHGRAFIFNLLSELDRVRNDWKRTFDRCRLLENQLKMEKDKTQRLSKENKQLVEENQYLNQKLSEELNQKLSEELNEELNEDDKIEQESVLNQSRKRSIDFITDDESQLPRKLRRSSSVPVVRPSISANVSCNRENLIQSIDREHAHPKRRSLGDDNAYDSMINREHNFVTKRNYISGIKCENCSQAIRYCVLYKHCNACKFSYHEQCSRKLEMPCLPRLLTPKRDVANFVSLRLVDHCPDTSPHIPHFIIRCVMQLEKVLGDERLYESMGDETKALKLLTDLKTKKELPDLTIYDNLTIAGCIMLFLMQIKETLIPRSSCQEFFIADSQEELSNLIESLPLPHRETLAYLVNHWKRLVEFGIYEDAGKELCSHIGPLVFGTSRQSQLDNTKSNEDASATMQRLIALPFDVLKSHINHENNSSGYNSSTPLSRNGSDSRKNKPVIVLSTVNT